MSKLIQSQVKHKFSAITSLHNAHQEMFPLKSTTYIYMTTGAMELDWMLDLNFLLFKNFGESLRSIICGTVSYHRQPRRSRECVPPPRKLDFIQN